MFYTLLESSLNQYCQLDPEYQKNLSRFQGKVIKIEIEEPSVNFYILTKPKGFLIQKIFDGKADATINASLLNYMFLLNKNEQEKSEAFIQKKISITGNLKLAQSFQEYFQHLDIDWEEHISHLTGDIIAHEGTNLFKHFFNFHKKTTESLSESLSEFLLYETRDLVTHNEIKTFIHDIDTCRNDVDRLEARLKRLIKNSQ